MRGLNRLCLLLAAMILAGINATEVTAQDSTGSGHPEKRTLGGYRFVPSNIIPDPFITTYFQQVTGVGLSYGSEISILVFDQDTLLSLNTDVAFVLLEFEYQYAASRRVAFRFRFSGSSRLGTGGEAILTQGVTAITGLEVGTSIALWDNGRTMVSGAADIFHGSTFRIDVAKFVEDFIEFGPDVASLTVSDDGVSLAGGFRLAHAFNEWSGIHALAQGAYRNTVRTEDFGVILGVAGSMDFGQRGGTPIGLELAASLDNIRAVESDVKSTMILGGGVFYTGREEFSLGLEIAYNRIPSREEGFTLNGVILSLTARFYF